MKNAFFALFLFLIAPAAFGQSSLSDWSSVESLKNRTNVIVETKSGYTLKGKVSSATAIALSFRSGGRDVTLDRDNIARVYLTRKGSALKRALWGAAAGAGIGVAVGAGVVAATKGDPLIAAGGFLYGIPVGAAIGALTTKRKRGELIYASQ